ncbi:hypothetical protein DUT91_13165 [Phyllobacterium salinisoli]|uniref:Uncharacterized protein n=1 Tax=Phyllobacterium salinisoli TaxID=1899321 RepID=A0A368K256_9HYPH|nr:hypothetical protein DUT91_13165 [Phyllobacterium salinisoli]
MFLVTAVEMSIAHSAREVKMQRSWSKINVSNRDLPFQGVAVIPHWLNWLSAMTDVTPITMKITLFVNASGGAMPTTIKPQAMAQRAAMTVDAVSETFGGEISCAE